MLLVRVWHSLQRMAKGHYKNTLLAGETKTFDNSGAPRGTRTLKDGKTSSGWIMRQVGSSHKQFLRVHFARRRDLSYKVSFWVLESAG